MGSSTPPRPGSPPTEPPRPCNKMIVPASEMIEMAIDQLKSETVFAGNEWVLPDQQKELNSVLPNSSNDFKAGYELGIQTARVLLSTTPSAIINKVSI